MWPFRNGPSREQRVELVEYANLLNPVGERCQSAFDEFQITSYVLGRKLHDEKRKLLDHVPESVAPLVDMVKGSLRHYVVIIEEAHQQVLQNPPAQWYPKKYWRTYERWLEIFIIASKLLVYIAGTLDDPPLAVELGKNRMKTYVLNLYLLERTQYRGFSRGFPSK